MANFIRYNPVSDLASLRAVMDRVVGDSFSPLTFHPLAMGDTGGVSPQIDVHQTDDEIVVTAALPGMKSEDLDMTITGQHLTLRGELTADEEIQRDQYLCRERRFGSFIRSFELPVRVQGDRATASFTDGVLTLRIPKAEEVKPRQIRISPGAPMADESENGTDEA